MTRRKHRINWNPTRMHGRKHHRINIVDYLRSDSATLVADCKLFCRNMISASGSANGAFFEQRAREFLEGLILTCVRIHGQLEIRHILDAMYLIHKGGEEWLDFAFEMQEAGYPISARIEEEIANARNDSSGGYQGILGELFKAFACYSDPLLLDAVSPPYDFSYEQTTDPDIRYVISLMVQPGHVGPWNPALKGHFVAAKIYKSRAPLAPRQTWLLDEMAVLANGDSKGFALAADLYTVDAGMGIRPVGVIQSSKQLDTLIPNGESIITASAPVRCYFAVRDEKTATTLSNMLGMQTLVYDDEKEQARSRHAADQAMKRMLDGADSFGAMMDYAHHSEMAGMRSKMRRQLRTPAEILHMAPGKQIIFADGLCHPIEADRKIYYEQRFMAGKFHPNPYYPPLDKVRVKTRFGHAWKRVIREPVQPEHAGLPQFADGMWTYIEPLKWWE